MKQKQLLLGILTAAVLCCSCSNIAQNPVAAPRLNSKSAAPKMDPLATLDTSNIDIDAVLGKEPCIIDRKDKKVYSAEQVAALDGTKNGYGQGYNVDSENRPTGAIYLQKKYDQYAVRFILESGNKNITLTFDEGYENGYTSVILDVLKEKHVKGVFFVTYDYVKSQPELVQRMIDEGHVVGNHSVHHYSMPTLDYEKCRTEILDLHQYVLDNFGYKMYLFRPPMGEYSEKTLAITESLGYTTVLWSFAYADWDPDAQPERSAALKRVCDSAHDGAIFLLHAVSKTNTEILGEVIDSFRADGFSLDLYI